MSDYLIIRVGDFSWRHVKAGAWNEVWQCTTCGYETSVASFVNYREKLEHAKHDCKPKRP